MKGRVCERKGKRESVQWISPLDPVWPWVGWKCTCNHALVPTQPESFQHRQSCHIVTQKNMTGHDIQTRSTNCPCPEKPLALLFTPPLPCFGDLSHVWKEKNQGECLRTGPQIRKRLCLHQLKMPFFRKSLHLWQYSLNLLTRQYGNNESIFKKLNAVLTHLRWGHQYRRGGGGVWDGQGRVVRFSLVMSQSQSESTWFMLLDLLWISSRKFSSCSMRTRFLNLCIEQMIRENVTDRHKWNVSVVCILGWQIA